MEVHRRPGATTADERHGMNIELKDYVAIEAMKALIQKSGQGPLMNTWGIVRQALEFGEAYERTRNAQPDPPIEACPPNVTPVKFQ